MLMFNWIQKGTSVNIFESFGLHGLLPDNRDVEFLPQVEGVE